LIAASGPTVTARARYLARNNGYAAAAIESFAGNAVGTGIKPATLIGDPALKAAIQAAWRRWIDESDAEGLRSRSRPNLLRRRSRRLFSSSRYTLRPVNVW